MGSILKMTARTIRSFFGRYLALLLIVALSVSFFAGLKVTKDAMYATAQDYLDTQNFCDFRLISTLGFSEDDVETLSREGYVGKVEGMKSVDVLIPYKEASSAFKLMSITEQVNLPALAAGRMPQTATECGSGELAPLPQYGSGNHNHWRRGLKGVPSAAPGRFFYGCIYRGGCVPAAVCGYLFLGIRRAC